MLVGCADGSLWSFNALAKLFSQKYERTYKVKLLEHEYRPVEKAAGAASRLLRAQRRGRPGIRLIERRRTDPAGLPTRGENDDARAEYRREAEKKKKSRAEAGGEGKKGRGARRRKAGDDADQEDQDDDEPPVDAIGARSVIHEPLHPRHQCRVESKSGFQLLGCLCLWFGIDPRHGSWYSEIEKMVGYHHRPGDLQALDGEGMAALY